MIYVIIVLSVILAVVSVIFIFTIRNLWKATDEIKEQKEANKSLQYEIGMMKEVEKIKNENRKESAQRMGGINYDNIDTALNILRNDEKK